MWLAKQFGNEQDAALMGGSFALDGTTPVLQSGVPLPLDGQLVPYGYSALPPIGAQVAAISVEGEDLLGGAIVRSPAVGQGEVLLRSVGGGYIHLLANGDILLNGVRITASGQIVPLSN